MNTCMSGVYYFYQFIEKDTIAIAYSYCMHMSVYYLYQSRTLAMAHGYIICT